jgi:outer membrane protein assembly factor BamB
VWLGALVALVAPASAGAQWPQWGGANRDFAADATGLAASWPEAGPTQLWARPLGAGYSSIIIADGRLYTMYRTGPGPRAERLAAEADGPPDDSQRIEDEVVVALDPKTGATIWESKYPTPIPEGMGTEHGKGPNSTPLFHQGRLYTLGVSGKLRALDAVTGKEVWSHDLVKEFGARVPGFGFSTSPVVYKNSLIVSATGLGVGVMSFDLAAGLLRWKKHDFGDVYSSPAVIQVDGEDEIVLLSSTQVVGLDPDTGDLDWQTPIDGTNIVTPLWGKDNILFVSSPTPDVGSRGLRLTKRNGKIIAEQAWESRKMQIGQSTAVRVGNHIYSSGAAIDAGTGQVAWQERGVGKANVIYGDGQLIILDEEGNLMLARASPEKLDVQSKVSLLKNPAWTPPTLVGRHLYIRDTETIMALDLGTGKGPT